MSETRSDVKPNDYLSRANDTAAAVTSVLGAVTATGTVVGLVWIVLEAFFLPDGLPRMDGASFATLASAVAVAGVVVIAFLSVAGGAAGLAFRGWRTTALTRYVRPFSKETSLESAHFSALVGVTALVSLTPLLSVSRWFFVAVPVTAAGIVILFARVGFEKITDWRRLLAVAFYSALSSLLWIPGAVLVTLIATAPESAVATGIRWLDDIGVVGFLLIAGMVNYTAAIAKLPSSFGVAFVLAFILCVLNPQAVLGAPFRALRLVDTVVRFPEPVSVADRASLKAFWQSCDHDVFRARNDKTYEVFVRQRIGSDWTVNCDRDGGTATFSRTLVSGALPVKSPTPAPVFWKRE